MKKLTILLAIIGLALPSVAWGADLGTRGLSKSIGSVVDPITLLSNNRCGPIESGDVCYWAFRDAHTAGTTSALFYVAAPTATACFAEKTSATATVTGAADVSFYRTHAAATDDSQGWEYVDSITGADLSAGDTDCPVLWRGWWWAEVDTATDLGTEEPAIEFIGQD